MKYRDEINKVDEGETTNFDIVEKSVKKNIDNTVCILPMS